MLVMLATALLSGAPRAVAAQARSGPSLGDSWPASWSAPARVIPGEVRTAQPISSAQSVPAAPVISPARSMSTDGSQVARLPVYDALGQVITLEEIQVRVDMSGLRGAFWTGLGLSSLGSLLGAALVSYDCNETVGGYYYPCSPREDAMRGAVPLTGFLLGAAVGAWIGWEADRTPWHEALEEIREMRRTGVRP